MYDSTHEVYDPLFTPIYYIIIYYIIIFVVPQEISLFYKSLILVFMFQFFILVSEFDKSNVSHLII